MNVVEVIDLYRSGFDPIFKVRDYAFFADESIPEDVLEHMGWREAILEAAGSGRLGFIKKRLAERWLRGKTLKQIVLAIGKSRPRDVADSQGACGVPSPASAMTAKSDSRALEAPRLIDRWKHFPAYQLERRADTFFASYLPDIVDYALGVEVIRVTKRAVC